MVRMPWSTHRGQRTKAKAGSFFYVDSKDELKDPYWLSHLTSPVELVLQPPVNYKCLKIK